MYKADAPNAIYAVVVPDSGETTRTRSEKTQNETVYAELDLAPKTNAHRIAAPESEYSNNQQLDSVYANSAQTTV